MNSNGLAAAFRSTTYRVSTPEGDFALRVGVADSAFDDWLGRWSLSPERPAIAAPTVATAAVGWGIVTAHNPGTVLAAHQNELRQQRLRDRLTALAWPFLPGCNLADDDLWPPEPSFLLLAVTPLQVMAIGREFEQRAVICGKRGSLPELCWL